MRKEWIHNKKRLLPGAFVIISILNFTILAPNKRTLAQSNRLQPRGWSQSQTTGSEDSNDVINMHTDLVSVSVTVCDRGGRAISGLSKDSFKIYDDKVEQPISFFSEDDTPASVGIVFDTSASMDDKAIEQAKLALSGFIQTSHPYDEFYLVGFSSKPQLLLSGVRDSQAVLDKFTYVRSTGNTALYDALYVGVEKVSHGVYPKQAIILISDGEENDSRYSFRDLRRLLLESGVVIYTIRVGNLPLPRSIGGRVMDQVAAISGGKSFWPGNAESMDEAFDQIALDLRRQYSIGYVPSNFAVDGKVHKIKIRLTAGPELGHDVVVRNREGYIATAKPSAH